MPIFVSYYAMYRREKEINETFSDKIKRITKIVFDHLKV